MDYASKQLNKIRNRIRQASNQAGRDEHSISLIGASKQQSAESIRNFVAAGLTACGENYLQEALQKQATLSDLAIEWHYIGKIQSNKTAEIATHFSWVHGVDRIKIANRLAQHSLTIAKQAAVQLLVQLNVDNEHSKGGVPIDQAATLCAEISELDGVCLRGFMLIPAPSKEAKEQRKPFALAQQTLQSINQQYGLKMDTLSMGMSADLEAAIAEGSTQIRIGTALFGRRN